MGNSHTRIFCMCVFVWYTTVIYNTLLKINRLYCYIFFNTISFNYTVNLDFFATYNFDLYSQNYTKIVWFYRGWTIEQCTEFELFNILYESFKVELFLFIRICFQSQTVLSFDSSFYEVFMNFDNLILISSYHKSLC